jgi:hypothetical protein
MYEPGREPPPHVWLGKPKYVAGPAELSIWDTITVQLTKDVEIFIDYGTLFRSLQDISRFWTREHVSDWIYNRQLHKRSKWNSKILRLCPEKPPRLAAPPPPIWDRLCSTDQVSQPEIPIKRSDSTVDRTIEMRRNFLRHDAEEAQEARREGAVEEITEWVLESMRPPYVCKDLPREDRDLFEFISRFIHERLMGQFELVVDELKSEHGNEMAAIWDASHRREGQLQRLEAMRLRKAAKQEERKEHFGKGAANLIEYRRKLAEQCLREIFEPGDGPSDDDDPVDLAAQATVSDDSILESLVSDGLKYKPSPTLRAEFLQEQIALSQMSESQKRQIRWVEWPKSRDMAFLLSAISERALLIGQCFAKLPAPRTIFSHYSGKLSEIEDQLRDPSSTPRQIDEFVERNGWKRNPDDPELSSEPIVSVSCDAAAMNADGSYLPAENSKYAFVIYGQPLDRSHHCMPLHVINAKSGQATETVQKAIDTVCMQLGQRGVNVKYVCSDGDAGYNTRHAAFFDKWFPEFCVSGLEKALLAISGENMIPVSDFLHLWKLFLARVKNHPLALSPDSFDHWLTGDRFEEMLQLGSALRDKSVLGKMRDCYALQFFSLKNCIKCLHEEQFTEFMYLLPFTLQEDVIRNPDMTREERLAKAILSFRLLMHYFDLCCGGRCDGIHERWSTKRGTEALTFAENAAWPRILNSALALIQFIIEADGNWSFSRLGSHCLENFFGFIRQNSRGDDRLSRAMHIIAKTQVVCCVMNDLGITMKHRGRDNVGGTVIGGSPIEFEELTEDIMFLESIIELSSLALDAVPEDHKLTLTQVTEEFILRWADEANHPDLAAPVPTPTSLSTKNCRILPRITDAQRAHLLNQSV